MKTLSLVMGILSICGMLLGFIPCFGAFNWLNIPFASIGLIIGIIDYANDKSPQKNIGAGIIMCIVAILFGIVRLILGGGIL